MKNCFVIILASLAFSLGYILAANAQDQLAETQGQQGLTSEKPGHLTSRLTPAKPAITVVQPWHESDKILIKFAAGSKVRIRQNDIASLGGFGLVEFKKVLARYGIRSSTLVRYFAFPETEIDQIKSKGEVHSGRELADLNNYYSLSVPGNLDTGLLCDELNSLAIIELAEPMPAPTPPPEDLGPPTDDYSGLQGYRAYLGITDHQGVAGIDGAEMAFVDVEYSWVLDHEDLELPAEANIELATLEDPFPDDESSHGTAVLGMIVGGENGYGVTGLAPKATAFVAPANTVEHGYNVARAIFLAILSISVGDVILIEQQTSVCGTPDYGPVEWSQSIYDVIAAATANGRIVVEAAGNGGVNLDVAACQSRFDPAYRDSGAIIVGAGHPTIHDRLAFSTYGSRVNVQGWGDSVVTTGYGDLFDADDSGHRQRYTRQFSGTSSASPIVAGAVLAIQGARKAIGVAPLAPNQMRQLLIESGTPQSGIEHIGPLPNVAAALMLVADPYDNFMDARNISGQHILEIGSNVNATKETGEPLHAGNSGGASVWWSWTPVNDSIVTINTFGSSFDTLLAVYTGTSVGALNLVAQNDDTSNGLGNLQSQIIFNALGGESYFIAVDGYNGSQGELRLNLLADTDGDGVYDHLDNCISIANPSQEPSSINPNCGQACLSSNCAGTFCENH